MPSNIFVNDSRLTNPLGREHGSPFSTYARQLFPITLEEVFNWAEFLGIHNALYSKAIQRAVRYFITRLDITGTKDFKVKRKYLDYLTDEMNILDNLATVGDDLMLYGNSFTSIFKPFHRNLGCPQCGSMWPIEQVDYEFTAFQFKGGCRKCAKKVLFKVIDTPKKSDELRIIRWNPRTIEIENNSMSGERKYYYEMHGKDKAALANGESVAVENTPLEIIEAVRNDQKFKFAPGEIYHMRNEVASSFQQDMAGWGLPPFLANFEQVVILQTLTRYNEAIVMDYLMPFRFISPGGRGGGEAGDMLLNIDAGRFMRSVEAMIKQHRKDPTSIHSVPYPVEYQALGGEAKQLAPVELIQMSVDMLLSSMGIPQELYKESLQEGGGPPIGLRMFERSWTHFTSQMNKYLDWVSKQCAKYLMWEQVKIRLIKNSVLEDDMSRQVKMQLLGANKLSNETAFGAFSIDYEWEVDRMLEEQWMFDEKVKEYQRMGGMSQQGQQMMDQGPQQQGQPGQPGQPQQGAPQGGGQGGGSGGQGGSIDQLDAEADRQAQQMITMDPSSRKSALIQLKKTDETLHALVTQKIKAYERRAAQTGVNQTRAGQQPIQPAPQV